jgi:hypothetical protein
MYLFTILPKGNFNTMVIPNVFGHKVVIFATYVSKLWMYLPMLAIYLENPNILTKCHPRYHLLNPLDIKNYNI